MNSVNQNKNDCSYPHSGVSSDFVQNFVTNPNFIFSKFRPAGFVIDFTTNKFLHLDNAIEDNIGIPANFFLSKCIDDYKALIHPQDLQILENKIYGKSLEFLQENNIVDLDNYYVSYNYRLKGMDDEYQQIFQRYNYVESKGVLCGMAGFLIDITPFKFDNVITFTIEKFPSSHQYPELIYKRIFHVTDANITQPLSTREVEILCMIARGLSTKQIAYKMSLSPNTISNHRKNMLQKMNCKSSSEMIFLADKMGLLTA